MASLRANTLALALGLCLLFFAVSCSRFAGNERIHAIPDWYGRPDVTSHKIIGYGSGESLSAADRQALAEISRQFEIWVESKTISKESKKTLSGDSSVERFYKQRIITRTSKKLKNPERVKKSSIQDKFFVRWEVDLSPEWQQLADKLIREWRKRGEAIPSELAWTGDKAYTSSRFCRKVDNYIERKGRIGVQKKIHFELFRKYDQWFVRVDNISQSIQDIYFAVNMKVYEKGEISLRITDPEHELLGHRISDGQRFCIQVNSPKEMNNCALVNIYPDGRVSLLKENVTLQTGKNIFPADKKAVFESNTLQGKNISLDVYIAVCGSFNNNLADFRALEINDRLPTGKSAYKVDRFISWLERSRVRAFDSSVVVTRGSE